MRWCQLHRAPLSLRFDYADFSPGMQTRTSAKYSLYNLVKKALYSTTILMIYAEFVKEVVGIKRAAC
jgi:hypothetical protein